MKVKDNQKRLYTLTSIAEFWGVSRSMAHLYFNSGRMDSPTHYKQTTRGVEWLWDRTPSKPKAMKPWGSKK